MTLCSERRNIKCDIAYLSGIFTKFNEVIAIAGQ